MSSKVINNSLQVKEDLIVSGTLRGQGALKVGNHQLTFTNDSGTEIVGQGTSAMNISSEGDLTICAGLNNDTGDNDTLWFGTRQGGGGSYYEMRLDSGKLSIGDNFQPLNTLHLKNVTGSALEVMRLDQEDVDEPFIRFEGTTAADQTKSLSTDTSVGSLEGHILVSINGADKWIPYYAKN